MQGLDAIALPVLQRRPDDAGSMALERRPRSRGVLGQAIRGVLAGAAATWLMDQVTTGLLDQQSRDDTEREEAARPNGKSSTANLVDRLSEVAGADPDPETRSRLASLAHYGLGIAPAAAYAVLRRRIPIVGAGGGLLYGIGLWALNDEYLNAALGLAGPWGAYPVASHWRGFVGHVVLGIATDSGLDALGA